METRLKGQTKKWYSADLHAGHKNIVDYTERKSVTTKELHDEWLVDTWNKQVLAGDLVYIVGDVSFYTKYEQQVAILQRLNGRKIIIKGNHDRTSDLNRLQSNNIIDYWKHYEEVKIKGMDTVLFHFPVASWHKQGYGSWHLHGHSHGGYKAEGKILDVGLDSAYDIFSEHRLFSEEDIETIMQTKERKVVDYHKER